MTPCSHRKSTTPWILAGLLLLSTADAAAQSDSPSADPPPRQAGTADLNAWSRQAIGGAAGQFTNPDTADWIPFHPRPEDVTAGGVLDVSRFVEQPSGTHGFLKQDGKGSFVFEDGTPARFLGGHISAFPGKEEAEWIVQWMRRHGLNYARAHGFGIPSPERWDRLDYLLYQCKKAGIYLVLTPIYWTEFDVVDPAGDEVTTSSHVILFFNNNMEQAVRDVWKRFYTHKNPYTGLRYADDPTLVAFEFKNEDSAFWALSWIRRGVPVFWAEMQQQYATFLKNKYATTDGLRTAWTLDGHASALGDDESIEKGNIELFEMAGWHAEGNEQAIAMRPRKSDQTAFLHKKQTEFYARSYRYLRSLGCKQAICGSNSRGHSYSMRHVLETDSHLDFLDQHDYFDHPQGGWITEHAVLHNQSMLKSPQAGLIGNLAPRQVMNRPYTVSEWNIGAWNEHLMEASFAMVSCGMLQGWDGLIHFVLIPRRWPDERPMLGNQFFNVGQNPSVILQYPTLARSWHRQDIAEAEPVFIRRIAPQQLHMPSAIASRFFPEAFMLTYGEEMPERDEYGHMLSVVGKVGNEFVSAPAPHYEADGIRTYLDQEGQIARSMTGELTWDWGQGYLLIDTPRTQAVCGYIGGVKLETKDTSLQSQTNYGTVLLTTLDDDQPIRESSRLLLTALGRARNANTRYGNAADRSETHDRLATEIELPPEQRVAILEVGEPPIISEPVRGKMLITVSNPDRATVYSLDDIGTRGKRLATKVTNGRLEINLPGNDGLRFLEIVVPNDH